MKNLIQLYFNTTVEVKKGPTFKEGETYEFGLDKEFFTVESATRWIKRGVATPVNYSEEVKEAISEEVKETISEEVKETISEEVKEIISEEVKETKGKANKGKTKVDNKSPKAENVL